MNEITFTVTVATDAPIDAEVRGFIVGAMGAAATEMAQDMGHRDAFVSIREQRDAEVRA